jgi:hypothetical protein
MPGYPSDSDGAEGDNGRQPDSSGLDAKLDRAVPTGEADAFLLGIGGVHGGRVYPLSHNTVFLGRADDADVCIPDPSVSARHARIINGSSGFEIEDLESTNGTFVEGRRIDRTHLRSGDRFTLGQVEFKFLVDRRVDATLTVIPGEISMGSAGGALVRYAPPRPLERDPRAAAPRGEDEGPSLSEMIGRAVLVYRFIRRNLPLIGVLAVIGAVVGLASAIALPPPREAVCLVKLQPQVKSNPMEPNQPRSFSADDDDSVQFFAGAEQAFIRPELVADTLHKVEEREADKTRVAAVGSRLRFEAVTGPGHLYRATYRDGPVSEGGPSPVSFLGAHLRNYLDFEITKALRVFTAEADFLRDQLSAVEKEMDSISAERIRYREKNADRLPEEAGLTQGSRFTLEGRRADLIAQVRRLQAELDSERRSLASEGPLSQTKFQESQVYRQSLADINRKLSEAYARGLADGHPDVIKLHDEKRRIEDLIKAEMGSETTQVDRKSNAGFQTIQNRVSALQAQLSAVRSDLGDTEKKLGQVRHVVGDLPRVEERVKQITHTQEEMSLLHSQLFERLKRAELQLNLERVSAESRYEIIAPPRLDSPGKTKTGAKRGGIGLLLGIVLATIIIAIKEGRRFVSEAVASLERAGGLRSRR